MSLFYAEPKTAYWATTRTEIYCSRCKCDSPKNEKWNFCPYCGAKMVGMTNADKFKEVFGFELNTDAFRRDYCVRKNEYELCKEFECGNCPYGPNWGEKEYIEGEED